MKKELRKEIETQLFNLQNLGADSAEYAAAIANIAAYPKKTLRGVAMGLSIADRAHVAQQLPPDRYKMMFRDGLR